MSDGFVLSKRTPVADQSSRTGNNESKLNKSDLNADDCYVMHKWRKERLWIERINAEDKGRKDWDENWSFLAEYDQKGNPKDKKVLPERVNMYTEKIPNSYGHEYGFRLNTDVGAHMQDMQNKFNAEHKLKRADDLICYD